MKRTLLKRDFFFSYGAKTRTPSAINYEEFQSQKPLDSRVSQVSELLTEQLSHFAFFFPPECVSKKKAGGQTK